MNFAPSFSPKRLPRIWEITLVTLYSLSLLPVHAVNAQLLANYNAVLPNGSPNAIISWWNGYAGDTVQIPVIVLTDSDSPQGQHTVSYGSYGRSSQTFTVGANGLITGGGNVDTITITGSAPYGYVMPANYTLGQSPPAVNTNFTVYLDYNASNGTYADSASVNAQSNFKWNAWAYGAGPDPQLGWECVYLNPSRNAVNSVQPVLLYLHGATAQSPNQPFVGCPNCGCRHMAVASLDRFQAGVSIADAPVGYTPPVGRDMHFQITYHQRLANQPSTFNFSNLGQQWSFNWLSYISGGPTNGLLSATYFEPGGNQYTYGNYQQNLNLVGGNNQGDFLDNQGWNLATLHYRQNPQRYERWLPDGTVETFSQPIGTSPNQLFFLSSITDPQGNVTKLAYDPNAAAAGNAILTSVTDPLGQQLIFSYESSNPLQITKVTRTIDGLSAKFEYANGQLTSSTDTIGITSAFTYKTGTNFINSMTTPYGTTTFSSTDGSGFLEADMTNPLGQNERVEYQESLSTSLFPASETSAPSAPGLTVDNSNLNHANSFYWTRRAISQAAANGITTDSQGFYALAQVSHWAESSLGSVPVPLSTKKPLEGRVWYNYPGQPSVDDVEVTAPGAMVVPSVTARLQDSGATQASFASYNSNGFVTQATDASGQLVSGSWVPGRVTNYTYASNNIDLTKVTQANSGTTGGQDTLATINSYNSQHEPLSITDAAGQTTTLTYNGSGQLLTRTVVVNSANQTTTLAYYAGGTSACYLQSVTGPVAGATTTYTYDTARRVQSVTDSEGYTIKYAYDNLDRPTITTYSDGSTEQTFYKALDVDHTIDRQGRVTRNVYDAIRELLQTSDPLGRITKYTWCTCGGLATLTDANGNVTTWGLDLQGRIISKTYADSSAINYVYENNLSRLHTMTDARGSEATYAYNSDDTLASISYTPGTGVAATPNVSFGYDPVYNRALTMTDGTGTTHYTYNLVNGALGAGRLGSVTVPIAGTSSTAALTYTYDELGRVVTRDVDQATTNANNVATTFDPLGRVTNVSNALGAFVYGYVDETGRLAKVTYPSGTGLSTSYGYYLISSSPGGQDGERLQEIKNMQGTTPLSDFQYSYNPVGTLATWQQQTDSSTPTLYTLGYDNADEVISAVQKNTSTNATVTSNKYNYDPAGNRLLETTLTTTAAGQFNNVNQLKGLSSSSTSETIAGHTTAAVSSVTIDDLAATITNSTNFTANVHMPSGTNVVSVVAQPTSTSGSITTQRYQVVASGSAPTALSYDANGNVLTDESGNTYTWDALNRLVGIAYHSGTYSGTHTEFSYDGLSRRVQILEKSGTTYGSGTVNSTKNYLWIGSEIAEERNASNTVTKRFFPQGEQQSGTNYYYTRDHLGSVREMVNGSGSIVARYAYDPYGVTTLVQGTNLATFQYARMMMHQPSGLYFTRNIPGIGGREYDPKIGWLSRDSIGEYGGINLYEYADNGPSNEIDPYGLDGQSAGEFGPDNNTQAAHDQMTANVQADYNAMVNALDNILSNIISADQSIFGTDNNDTATQMAATAAGMFGPGGIPGKAKNVLDCIRKTGKPPPGYKGGQTFKNLEKRLPPGNYKEYDVDPLPPSGTSRNAERIVIDQNTGQAYYTDDHYTTFTPIP